MNAATAVAAGPAPTARDPMDLLDRTAIAREYKIPVATQCSWHSLDRYGWRSICIKLGARVMVRRKDIEAWLDSRRGLV